VDLQSKLRWLQRKLTNKKKGSANYQKVQAKIRKLHEHIHNVRREFHFLTVHKLCDDAGMIFADDLRLKMMSHGMLAKRGRLPENPDKTGNLKSDLGKPSP
jgi:putative transposase